MKITLNEFITKLQELADQGHGEKPVGYEYDSFFRWDFDGYFDIQATRITTRYGEEGETLEHPIDLDVVHLHS